METFLKFTPYVLYGLGLIGVGVKSYYDIQNLRERMKETETQLKDYSLLQTEINMDIKKEIESLVLTILASALLALLEVLQSGNFELVG